MTPLAGFIAAVIAGWLIRDPRRATAAIVAPFLVVLTAQTWGIAAGYGHSPPSTITSFPGTLSYWLVQLIIVAPALVIAAELGALRARSARSRGVVTSPRRAVTVSALLTLAAGAFAAVYAAQVSPITHHQTNGSPPAWGFAGMGLLFVVLVVLSVVLLWVRRTDRRRTVAGAQPSAVPAAGRR